MENIITDILGMRDLYYANIISFDDFVKFINEINKNFKLRFEKILVSNSIEPFTNMKYEGYKNKQCIYSIYVVENL